MKYGYLKLKSIDAEVYNVIRFGGETDEEYNANHDELVGAGYEEATVEEWVDDGGSEGDSPALDDADKVE